MIYYGRNNSAWVLWSKRHLYLEECTKSWKRRQSPVTLYLHLSVIQGWSTVRKCTDKGRWHLTWAVMVLRDNRGFLANSLQCFEQVAVYGKIPCLLWSFGQLMIKCHMAVCYWNWNLREFQNRNGDKMSKNKTLSLKRSVLLERNVEFNPTRSIEGTFKDFLFAWLTEMKRPAANFNFLITQRFVNDSYMHIGHGFLMTLALHRKGHSSQAIILLRVYRCFVVTGYNLLPQ